MKREYTLRFGNISHKVMMDGIKFQAPIEQEKTKVPVLLRPLEIQPTKGEKRNA
jgi:hypothetical protein